ncbi:hypothetical protein Bbelb_025330 [Branchiostoma belcheri]|nr:hypothetical protein Bbelb_025330 [Branchiostoma belcheri]
MKSRPHTSRRLHFLRPVLEYGHVLLVDCSKKQDLSLERVQRRALKIISLGGRRNVPDLPTLRERRELAAVKLLKRMLSHDHPLHDLVPGARSDSTGRCLRNSGGITVPKARTNRLFNSFLHCTIRLLDRTFSQSLSAEHGGMPADLHERYGGVKHPEGSLPLGQ